MSHVNHFRGLVPRTRWEKETPSLAPGPITHLMSPVVPQRELRTKLPRHFPHLSGENRHPAQSLVTQGRTMGMWDQIWLNTGFVKAGWLPASQLSSFRLRFSTFKIVVMKWPHISAKLLAKIKCGMGGFPGGSVVKNLPANAGDAKDVCSVPGQEDPLESEMASHSNILAWRTPWTEESGRLQSRGSRTVGHD